MSSSITPPDWVDSDIQEAIAWAEGQGDAATIAEAAKAIIEAYQRAVVAIAQIRFSQISVLKAQGWSYDDLAEAFNLGRTRIWQICNPKEKNADDT